MLIGLACSGLILPRTKYPIRTGTIVTARTAAAAIAYVFVNASGLKSRPSCASSAKTGINETVITSSDQNNAGPTSFDASRMISHCPLRSETGLSDSCSKCLCAFSIMIIAASTIAPIAIAIPPSDMIFALTPCIRMTMNDKRIAVGSVKTATKALRA